MTVFICVDNRMGMRYNHRRQSRDRALTEKILALSAGHILRMSPYSAPLFPAAENIAVSGDFLAEAGEEDFCFVEDADILPRQDRITRLFLCHWNRDYPADEFCPLSVEDRQSVSTEEFPGTSHERITLEEYIL